MTAVFAVFLMLLLAVGAFVGANFCVSGGGAQQALLTLGGGLIGAIFPSLPGFLQGLMSNRDSQKGHTTPTFMMTTAFVSLALGSGLFVSTMGCKQVKPDVFLDVVVDCAKINPETSSAASGVMTCLTAAIAGNPGACLSQLVTVAHFAVDEVACIVADIAQRENRKVQLEGDLRALEIRNAAVFFLRDRNVSIKNSYAGAQ